MDYIEHRLAQEAAKVTDGPAPTAFLTPLNLLLSAALVYALYGALAPTAASKMAALLPPAAPPVLFRRFTPRQLLPFNGEDDRPVYLAVRGRVFDVSPGRNFYGPHGPYANFAGRDASRGLACGSFDPDVLTADLDGPLDPLDDLDALQIEALMGWEERFLDKYDVVGSLVAAAPEPSSTPKPADDAE